jgi:sortase A
MSPIRTTPRTFVMLSVCLLAVGLWQIGEGSWIYAKARLAQYLLQRAWSRTLAGESTVKPWPWADTWPVARLTVSSKHIDLIVLNGAYGRTLAFGPGYAESSSFPGSPGTTIVTGHRDTHFEFLKRLKRDDEIVVETAAGITQRYLVQDSQIVDARTASISLADGVDQLALVTCYPFDTIAPGGPLRYVVSATRLPPARPRSTDRPADREWARQRGSIQQK